MEINGRRLLELMDWALLRITREMEERGGLPCRIGLAADLTNPCGS